jgi:hypothetical protein
MCFAKSAAVREGIIMEKETTLLMSDLQREPAYMLDGIGLLVSGTFVVTTGPYLEMKNRSTIATLNDNSELPGVWQNNYFSLVQMQVIFSALAVRMPWVRQYVPRQKS